MAQAALDLSNHLDVDPQSLVDTDELLSQLAGDEIDRLLAEADSSPPSSPVNPKLPVATKAAFGSEVPITALAPTAATAISGKGAKGDLPAPIPVSSAPKVMAPPVEATLVDEHLDQQLDKLFTKINSPVPAALDNAVPAAVPDAQAVASVSESIELGIADATGEERSAVLDAAGFERPTSDSSDSSSTNPATIIDDPMHELEPMSPERSALLVAAGFDSTAASSNSPAQLAEDVDLGDLLGDDDAPLPFYLKPLEWMNAPLAACPPPVRQILGKVGIVTMVNALAVLMYILLFRKH